MKPNFYVTMYRKKKKVILGSLYRKKQEKENEETRHSVEEDRKLQIQAAITRIMKSRQKLEHNILVSEVISQLHNKFKPDEKTIKQCINILIEKNYLKRDEHDPKIYCYIE